MMYRSSILSLLLVVLYIYDIRISAREPRLAVCGLCRCVVRCCTFRNSSVLRSHRLGPSYRNTIYRIYFFRIEHIAIKSFFLFLLFCFPPFHHHGTTAFPKLRKRFDFPANINQTITMKAFLVLLSCLKLIAGENFGGSLRAVNTAKPVEVLVLTEALW